MTKRQLMALGFASACWLLPVGIAVGQVITGTIVGDVQDESGAVLPGATVTITSDQLPGGPRVSVTNEKGQYRFPNLPPGTYALEVEMSSFGTYREEAMRVVVGGSVVRTVTLALGTLQETVTVTGESPIVDTRKSGVSTNFSNEYMENTPLRRFSFFDFTKAAPGMSATNPTSGTSSRVSAFGSNVDENAYLMDGTDFTAPVSGAAWPWPDTDTIEEIEIISLGASAEYGNITGAVFNVVTKQGTNDFRVDGAYFGMSDGLTSKPILRDCNCPEGETGFTRNKYRDFTVHAGFPVVPDKAWLYAGYQYQRDYDNQPGTDPRFPRKFEADRLNYKFTWQVTDSLKFMSTYHDDYWVIPSTPSISSPFETVWTFSGHNPSLTFGNITHVLSDSTFYDVRVSGFYSPADLGENNNPGVSRRRDVATGIDTGGAAFSGGFKQARTAVNGKLSHYATDFMGADHDFKFGVQYANGSHSGHYGYTNGISYYDYNGEPYYAYLRERYNYGGQFKNTGVFAEDLLSIGERATVQIGLRFDHTDAISQEVDNLDQNLNKVGTIPGLGNLYSWNTVSPRLGFAIRLDDAGETLVRGNWGRYYRAVITGELINVHPGQTPITLAFFDPATGGYTDIVDVTQPGSDEIIDPSTTSPRTDTLSIGLDQQIRPDLAASITYVHKRQRDLISWNVDNATFGTDTAVLDDGRTIPVFPILTDPGDRVFRMGNRDDLFMNYDGVILSLNKRWADNWQGLLSYGWSDASGIIPSSNRAVGNSQESRVRSSSVGRDPNDFTNAEGNLLNDRTHMFRITGAFEIPVIDVRVGANLQAFTGKPYAANARVRLPQGSRTINVETPGARRLPTQKVLDLRISKIFRFGDTGKIELLADILNLLNEDATEDVVSQNVFSSNLGVGDRWIDPRRAFIGIKFAY